MLRRVTISFVGAAAIFAVTAFIIHLIYLFRPPTITPAIVQGWVDALPANATRDQVLAALKPRGFDFSQTNSDRLDGTQRVGYSFMFNEDIDVHFTFKQNGEIDQRIVVPMSRGP